MVTSDFAGFPEDLFAFLRELAQHNNREWFARNKQRYEESIVWPMAGFINAMGGRLETFANCFIADPRRQGGSMFRIHRDIRFSRDKRPYKENIGCQFRHMAGRDAHAPGFYVHLAPNEVFFGGGIWRPPSEVLGRLRQAIEQWPEAWRRVVEGRSFRRRFGAVVGEQLQRPPRGFAADHPWIEDLKRKSYYAVEYVEPQLALTPAFLDEVAAAFRDLAPLMRFLTAALGLPFHR